MIYKVIPGTERIRKTPLWFFLFINTCSVIFVKYNLPVGPQPSSPH